VRQNPYLLLSLCPFKGGSRAERRNARQFVCRRTTSQS
jgi:hypothetical protein